MHYPPDSATGQSLQLNLGHEAWLIVILLICLIHKYVLSTNYTQHTYLDMDDPSGRMTSVIRKFFCLFFYSETDIQSNKYTAGQMVINAKKKKRSKIKQDKRIESENKLFFLKFILLKYN